MTPSNFNLPSPQKTCRKGLHVYDVAAPTCPQCNKSSKRRKYLENRDSAIGKANAYYQTNHKKITEKRSLKRERLREERLKKAALAQADVDAERVRYRRARWAWEMMIRRCNDPAIDRYVDYGGRGITVCNQWMGKGGFEKFERDMGPKPGPTYSLDRIDNDKGYSPENCEWRTPPQQNRNRRDTFMVTFDGKTQCLTDWATETGMSRGTLKNRISNLGWSVERALTDKIGDPDSELHAGLCRMAAGWLEKKCHVVLRDVNAMTGEIPDAIGWRGTESYVVECKVSRANFLVDECKKFRSDPCLGMGEFRYYMVPEGLVAPDEVPPDWGLLYVGSKIKVVRESKKVDKVNRRSEMKMLVIALRRAQLRIDKPLHEWLRWDAENSPIRPKQI